MAQIKRSLATVIKLVIALGAIIYVYFKLKQALASSGNSASLSEVLFDFPEGSVWLVLLALVMVILNLGLEAAKWWNLQRSIYPELTYQQSFQAILVGMTTGIFTPNRLGEYAGRVFFLPSGFRIEATVLTFIDRISQMLVTLVIGGLAFYAFVQRFGSDFMDSGEFIDLMQWGWMILGAAILIIVPITLFNPSWFASLLKRITPGTDFFTHFNASFKHMPAGKMAATIILSLLRYATFTLQYVILMIAFGFEESLLLGAGIAALVFLFKSLIPFIGLSELGIRESVAIHVMGLFGLGAFTAFKATFFLYVINIILPTLAGLFFIRRLKFRSKEPT